MEAPKCKLCGERHSLREPHVFSGRQPKPRLVGGVVAPSTRCPECVGLRTELEQSKREVEQLVADVKQLRLALEAAHKRLARVTENQAGTVTGNRAITVTERKRGRPKTGKALSGAERIRQLRAKAKRGKAKDQAGI